MYHKPPDAFVTRVKTIQRTEEDDYPDGGETGYSESPSHPADSAASPPDTSSNAPHAAARQPVAAPVPDLLGDLIGLDNDNTGSNAIASTDQPAVPTG